MTKKKNIQDEVAKIHSKYGVTEMANYKIQLLFEEQFKAKVEEVTDEEILKEAEELKSGNPIDKIYYIGWKQGAKWLKQKLLNR